MFYIHIGVHKTGSTTLQRFFRLNADVLAEAGVLYPDIGISNSGHHEIAHAARRGEFKTGLIAELSAFAKANGDAAALISTEAFDVLRRRPIKRLVASLKPHEAKVFVYVRDFTRLVPSKYSQLTKSGENLADFDAFFERVVAREMAKAELPIERWASIVGWPNVRIRALDPRSLVGGELIPDALDALGLDQALLERCDPATLRPVNTTPHWTAVEAVRAVAGRLAAAGIAVDRGSGRPVDGVHKAVPLGRICSACELAALQTGLAQRPAQYLTPEQWRFLAERYQAEVDALAAASPGPRLPDAARTPPPKRPFLPSLDALSAAERSDFRDAVADSKRFPTLEPAARDVVLRVISKTNYVPGTSRLTARRKRRPLDMSLGARLRRFWRRLVRR